MTPEQRKHFKYVRDEMHGEAQPAVALEHEWLRGECVKCGASIERQEPVAWMSEHRFDELRKGFTVMTTLTKQRAFEDDVAIYTTPPQHSAIARKPLTDAEFAYVWREETGRIMGTDKALLLRAKQITEAAHGIKE